MTDIAASPATIRAVGAALGRGRLYDDKLGGADEGRIAAWAEAAEPYQLSHEDMLAAVTAYYTDTPDGRTMQVADLIRHARAIRRERAERESDRMRDARQAQIDARVAEHVAEITQILDAKYERASKRHGVNPLSVRCAWCHASPGDRCVIPRTSQALKDGFHPSRVEAAEAKADA